MGSGAHNISDSSSTRILLPLLGVLGAYSGSGLRISDNIRSVIQLSCKFDDKS